MAAKEDSLTSIFGWLWRKWQCYQNHGRIILVHFLVIVLITAIAFRCTRWWTFAWTGIGKKEKYKKNTIKRNSRQQNAYLIVFKEICTHTHTYMYLQTYMHMYVCTYICINSKLNCLRLVMVSNKLLNAVVCVCVFVLSTYL